MDSSDLVWCQDTQRLEDSCVEGLGSSRCNVTLGLPGQCYADNVMLTDDLYQCLDRSDASPYTKRTEGYDRVFLANDKCGL